MFPVKHPEDLARFVDLLKDHGVALGLVGFPPSQAEQEVDRSLALQDFVEGITLLDVGSGAGLPGIPLGIARGEITLVEPKRKALGFLEKAARELTCKISIHPYRAEELVGSVEADTVVARALAPPSKALSLCAPLATRRVVLTARADSRLPEERLWKPLGFVKAEAVVGVGPDGAEQRALVFDRA